MSNVLMVLGSAIALRGTIGAEPGDLVDAAPMLLIAFGLLCFAVGVLWSGDDGHSSN